MTRRETPKASAAFEEYAAMGPSRSLRKLSDKIGTKLSQLGTWSSEFNWQEKVKPIDAAHIEEKRQRREFELEKMNTEHASLGRAQALRAVEQIDELIKAKKFGSQASVQLFKISTDLQRLALGAATERKEITGVDGGPVEKVVFYMPLVDGDDSTPKGGDADAYGGHSENNKS